MKQFSVLTCALLVMICASLYAQEQNPTLSHAFNRAQELYTDMKQQLPNTSSYPRTVGKDGKLRFTKGNDWTDGFYPGCLWYLYEYTQNPQWKQDAIEWTETLEPLKKMTWNHDIGFIMYCSFGNGYRLVNNEKYKDILIESANSLLTRYNREVGCTKSWNGGSSWDKVKWQFPVIIDNMMNLELLYFATKVTGDKRYAEIATTHARTTAREHFRKDNSTYHVVNYDPKTGKPLNKQTCQGFADNSTWARGQAWAIYGFTMVYRETKKKEFLKKACQAADFWINHPNLPQDKVPYWDFNAGQEGYTPTWDYNAEQFKVMPRDASAAAIVASALFELSQYVNKKQADKYYKMAVATLESLSSPTYLAEKGTNESFILKHCVGSIPHKNEIDVPLTYADYYYLEALLRYQKSLKNI